MQAGVSAVVEVEKGKAEGLDIDLRQYTRELLVGLAGSQKLSKIQ